MKVIVHTDKIALAADPANELTIPKLVAVPNDQPINPPAVGRLKVNVVLGHTDPGPRMTGLDDVIGPLVGAGQVSQRPDIQEAIAAHGQPAPSLIDILGVNLG